MEELDDIENLIILKLLLTVIFYCPFGNTYIIVHFVPGVHIILYVIFKTLLQGSSPKPFRISVINIEAMLPGLSLRPEGLGIPQHIMP